MKGQSKTEIVDVGDSGFFDDDDQGKSYGGYAVAGDSHTNMSINTNNSIVRGADKNFHAQPFHVKSTQNIQNRQPFRPPPQGNMGRNPGCALPSPLTFRNPTPGLQPFFNNRQNFGSERQNPPQVPNQRPMGMNRNYPGQTPSKAYGALDNVSMENNPSSNLGSKSQRSGFDPQQVN